jgi:hypothetical protein
MPALILDHFDLLEQALSLEAQRFFFRTNLCARPQVVCLRSDRQTCRNRSLPELLERVVEKEVAATKRCEDDSGIGGGAFEANALKQNVRASSHP